MIKYAKVINETGLCEVGVGTDYTYYKKMGLIELDVQKSDIDGQWYLSEKCPMKSEEERIKDLVEKRNLEIEQKISELQRMALSEVIEGNKDNISTYNQIISSLRDNLVIFS